MHVILIVFGLLLIVFGGGCVLIVGISALADPSAIVSDFGDFLLFGGLSGLLPLLAGLYLFRLGMRIDREKRKAMAAKYSASSTEKTP